MFSRRWWAVVLILGLLLIGYVSYLALTKNYYYIIGKCAGRWVAAQSIISESKTGKIFSITINGKIIYMEMVDISDGKLDSIVHLENGVDRYVTSIDKAGNTDARQVIYYSTNGDKYAVYDSGGVGIFTQRLWQPAKGKVVKEYLEGGCWKPIGVRSNNPSDVISPANER